MRDRKRLLVSAGEHSGDLRAGALIGELKKRIPGLQLKGIGGSSLQALGLASEFDLKQLSVMGFVEVLKHLPFFMRVMKRMELLLDQWEPDRLLLIDYPGFNLRLAARAAQRGIPTTYYISPQVWAWGGGRVKRIVDSVDQMLVLFRFEVEFYRRFGLAAEFVGHPLVDELAAYKSSTTFREDFGLGSEQRILSLLPGSRMQEVNAHLPVLLETARRVPDLVPIVGLAPGIPDAILKTSDIRRTRHIHDLLAHSHLAVAASGTVTLEAALLRTPMIVVYKTGRLSGVAARFIIRLPYVAMVNVVAGKMVVPEYLQGRLKPELLVEQIKMLAGNEDRLQAMRHELSLVAAALGPKGASARAAELLAEKLVGSADVTGVT
jgi:lipid-A-disaccharide synthase